MNRAGRGAVIDTISWTKLGLYKSMWGWGRFGFGTGRLKSKISWDRQHRARPCKKRKDGAPTLLIASARSKAWATRLQGSGVPSGTRSVGDAFPPVKLAGYCRSSLRD